MEGRSSQAAAESDFAKQRRRRALSLLAARLRSEPDDVSPMLPFEEVVAALGRVSETDLGVREIPLDAIIGTVDRQTSTFDRSFRPATTDVRGRWQRVNAARRRGEALPPIDVYQIGDLYFVQDGHHRVSVARAMGDKVIEAHVRLVKTRLDLGRDVRIRDLPLKQHERVFFERVPLPPAMRKRIQLKDEWRWAQLGVLVESWGFRVSHAREHLMSREEMALAWFTDEYEPIVRVLNEGGLAGAGTETERYLRVAMLRYLLLTTHDWDDDVIRRLLGEPGKPGLEEDTMVHEILKEIKDSR